MQQQLVIFLHASDPEQTAWVVIDENGMIKKTVVNGNTSELKELAANKIVKIMVPAEHVLLTTIKLPKLSRARLREALPYALEEQLAADIETLHFAHGEYEAEGNVSVAVVAKEKMQHWLTLLNAWEVQPDAFFPSSLALPFTENIWHVLISDIAILRTGLLESMVFDTNNLIPVLESALAAATTTPQQIYIHNYTTQSLAQLANLSIPYKEDQLRSEQLLTDLAHHSLTLPEINLLQGTFAITHSGLIHLQKLWRTLIALSVTLIALLCLTPMISYLLLNHKLSSINKQISQIYKRNFPDSTSMIAPKTRMQEKLQTLRAQQGNNQFLLLSAYVGKAMLHHSSIRLKRLTFQNDQLTLELTAASSDDFAAFTDSLQQQGATLKQQNVALAGEEVSATVVIA